ncbi:MAG: GNAT family N-acetyltransferase [Deltaproteobacteria bacterium]|jgi:GNAT superfamily N-acetyltransferase|nr:GNAT family N-acetyltransferase [Deltaproteobacteria bacterium]
MTTQIYLRKPDTGDEEALAVLCGELGYPSSAHEIVERLSHFLDREDHFVLVAADASDRPVGWIHACIVHRVESDAFVEIGGMVVLGEHRGAGIGTQLLGKTEEWARSQKVRAIRVQSNVVRKRAQDFYERAGYKQTKTSQVFLKPLQGSHRS